MYRFIFTLFYSFSAFAISSTAMAQSVDRQQFMRACMGDYQRFCYGVRPGGGRILSCLSQHTSQLAPDCAAIVGVGLQCVGDYRKFCWEASPQNGELQQCMEKNIGKLSQPCAQVVSTNTVSSR